MDKTTFIIVKKFVRKLKNKYPDAEIYLFGSRARGDNFKTSDFDFLIISEKFTEKPWKRMSAVLKIWNEKYDIEVICFTFSEVKKLKDKFGVLRQALKEGIKVS